MTTGRTAYDRVPFVEFYRMHWRDAARWASAVTGRVDVGEEVAQDVFGRMAERYDSLDNPVGYLRTSVVNAARSWVRSEDRSRRRDARVSDQEVRSSGGDGDGDPVDVATLALIDALPERQRLVVILRYWADWSDADVAAALGCPTSTVRSLARRGLATLRDQMTRS